MKRIMALVAVASVMALLALPSQAAAQDGPTLTIDPPAVDGPGTHTFTINASGWSPGLLVFIVPCSYDGDQLTTASTADDLAAAEAQLDNPDNCVRVPIGGPAPVGGDGTFSLEITHDVPANFMFGSGDATAAETAAVPVLFVAEDMGEDAAEDTADDMAPEGAAETGFGGMAGSDGNSVAVPLAATLAAVVLLGGAALVTRRHS